MEGYISAKELAERWGISARRVQILCTKGQIEGVSRFGNAWVIPENAVRPVDARVTTGEYRDWRKKLKKNQVKENQEKENQ